MDYPAAWNYARTTSEKHDPNCSFEQTNGAILCDCHVLWNEVARRESQAAGSEHEYVDSTDNMFGDKQP